MDTQAGHASLSFTRELRRALQHLYDPASLGKSQLIELLSIEAEDDSPTALCNTLLAAIEGLKPSASVPPQANAWRVYHILSQRYAEQFTQRQVGTNLALSTRQLARLEHAALRLLADTLWRRDGVAMRAQALKASMPQVDGSQPLPGQATPSPAQELQWLKQSLPNEPVDAAEMIRAVLKVALPLAQELRVRVELSLPESLPYLAVQATTIRQALLNILTAAIASLPGGRVDIDVRAHLPVVWVDVCTVATRRGAPPLPLPGGAESLAMARQLVELSGGSIELQPGPERRASFAARVILPAAAQVTVLVIDDNLDTLLLMERCLSGSRYRFVGTSDPAAALALAGDVTPQIIVLDVMLPRVDGWELLGRLRQHPKTHGVPVVVCTILPQEGLARSLGAAMLVRKPVTPATLLAALDQQLAQSVRGSC